MSLKLRASVSVVERPNNVIEFFKTNSREQVMIKANPIIKTFLAELDGSFTLSDYIKRNKLEDIGDQLREFVVFLKSKGILSNSSNSSLEEYESHRRVIHFIEDYSQSDEHLVQMWENIRNSKVVIIGLGAVGTWVATNLVQSGVGNIVLIDNDKVELSNIHRQTGYKETDIGELKTKALKARLHHLKSSVVIDTVDAYLDENLLETLSIEDSDLIINCSDYPNVDTTTLWVGEYGMQYNIPHIVGGGYNMHLSLIGQTILPYETACVKCFEEQLKKINNIDPTSVRKLAVKNRKIGSFGPMCALIASIVGMEAIKVLTKEITPANVNRRGEFNIYSMMMDYHYFDKLENCSWCGKEAKKNV